MGLQRVNVAKVFYLIRLSRRVVSGKELGPKWSYRPLCDVGGGSVRFPAVSGVCVVAGRGHTHEIIVRLEGELACKVMEKFFASIYKRLAVFREPWLLTAHLGSMEGQSVHAGYGI
jgi:hypothetical protein